MRPRSRPCLPVLRGRAPDDVVDIGGVDVVARGQRLQHSGAKMLGVHVGQRALADAADATGVRVVSMIQASVIGSLRGTEQIWGLLRRQ